MILMVFSFILRSAGVEARNWTVLPAARTIKGIFRNVRFPQAMGGCFPQEGSLGSLLGHLGTVLGRLEAILGPFRMFVGHLGAIRGLSEAV